MQGEAQIQLDLTLRTAIEASHRRDPRGKLAARDSDLGELASQWPVQATVGSACDARLHFKSVPNFSLVFLAFGSSPHTTEPEKGNPITSAKIKTRQCQNPARTTNRTASAEGQFA